MSANPDNIASLAAALRLVAIGGRELWGFEEIAAYSKFERNYVANVITAKPDFPKPIRVNGKAKDHPRYVAADVMAWFEGKREN